jgi:hypothetical protein
MQFSSITNSNTEQFSTGLTLFKSRKETAKCMRYADIGALQKPNLYRMQWIYQNNFDRFKRSSILRQKFIDLRSEIGNDKRHKLVGSTQKFLENEVLEVLHHISENANG